MHFYRWCGRASPDIVLLWCARHGRQIWTVCKTHKATKCSVTRMRIAKGSQVYRPMTHRSNRADRISKDGIIELQIEHEQKGGGK
ncbi:MAG TPA: hypothetical protein VMW16_00050 [Sedimentisphaerales bacterium]|nr:hypothetical protein [Sedimentisphaerales bacterium]